MKHSFATTVGRKTINKNFLDFFYSCPTAPRKPRIHGRLAPNRPFPISSGISLWLPTISSSRSLLRSPSSTLGRTRTFVNVSAAKIFLASIAKPAPLILNPSKSPLPRTVTNDSYKRCARYSQTTRSSL